MKKKPSGKILYLLKVLLGIASVLTLGACGLKGDLYLPESKVLFNNTLIQTGA